jgi:hypothetical protein
MSAVEQRAEQTSERNTRVDQTGNGWRNGWMVFAAQVWTDLERLAETAERHAINRAQAKWDYGVPMVIDF